MSVETAPPAVAVKPPDHNRTGIDFHAPMPRPKVKGAVIDFHCHMLAARHAPVWFEAGDHYGIDCFLSMTPLEEVMKIQREHGDRVQFIAVASWQQKPELTLAQWLDDYLRRVEMFYNLGSRMVKFHMAPGSIHRRGIKLDDPRFEPFFEFIEQHKMAIMTHIGDPDTWYNGKYADGSVYGTRDEHFAMWRRMLERHPSVPWIGAHMGGNPESLPRLQEMLDDYPQLSLDCSATRWMARELSKRRDEAREFFIRNADRIMWGSDQVSTDERGYDFLASRWWVHRKLIETAYIGRSPIFDPDLPEESQTRLEGMALPDEVLQKLYHDNAVRFLDKLGVRFDV